MIAALLGTALLAQTAGQPVPSVDVEARVPGKASVWLAGSSPSAIAGWYVDGGGTRRYDQMPNCGPTKIALRPGMTSFTVVSSKGEVRIADEMGVEPYGPTGDLKRTVLRNRDQSFRGPIGEVAAPIGSLIGVYLPEVSTDHPANQSGWQVGRVAMGQKQVVPKLYTPFYIGDGRLADNTPVEFVIPKGSATLYLGIMGESGWARNEGEFQVVLKFASPRRPQGG
ncbi:MAG: hypothetical protein H3C58_12015 [Fimbriimonadaceae bacterium]|nr:hypothetical protein [Fimbriimonadaceae bacterium]